MRTQVVRASDADMKALDAAEPDALIKRLREQKATALAVIPGGRDKGVGQELASLAHVPGLSALALAPELAVYAPERSIELGDEQRDETFVSRERR